MDRGVGWQQGSLLPPGVVVPTLQWIASEHPQTKVGRKAVDAARRSGGELSAFVVGEGARKSDDRVMVLTQTCDLTKPAEALPQVEVARVFATTNQRTVAQAQDFGSARFFRLDAADDGSALVLDYGQRALVEKGVLRAVSPDNDLVLGWDGAQREKLARWLGQRYARPAIPDDDYELITRPVRDAWRSLAPEAASTLNREYAEWRYRRESDGSLTLYTLSRNADPDPLVALEVADFLTQAIEPEYPGPVHVATDRRSYHQFTKADELSTHQISMEWASHEDDGWAALPAA